MKKIILILITFLSLLNQTSYAQTPTWKWVSSILTSSSDQCNSMAVDVSGNSYITGYFIGSNLTIGTFILHNADPVNNTDDIFVAKYDSSGNVLWAKKFGSVGDEDGNAIAVDDSENVYIAGDYASHYLSFGTTTLTNTTNNSNTDVFFVKLDKNGNVIWAKSIGSTGLEFAKSIAIDTSGNVYLCGYFDSPTLNIGNDALSNSGGDDIFLAKYDANGNVLWAKKAGGSNEDVALSMAVDPKENVYITGDFTSTSISFDTINLTSTSTNGHANLFIAKYDKSGNLILAKSAGCIGSTGWVQATTVGVDTSQNMYVSGWFGYNNFNIGSSTLNYAGLYDIFFIKYDKNGNVIWAKGAGGSDVDQPYSITVDDDGNSYLGGSFQSSSITFGNITLNNPGIFLTKYDPNGNVLWAKGDVGYNSSDNIISVKLSSSRNIYITGNFSDTTFILDNFTIQNPGEVGIFIAKSNISLNGINEIFKSNTVHIYPNPAKDNLTIETNSTKEQRLEIINLLGQTVYTSSINKKAIVNTSAYPCGVYIIKLYTDKETAVKKFVKQ